ncbi:TPA: hypothetical protein N0F65_001261 [Lagenidium giganteum]|uniref:PA domain-containing protein n=1 Tax=Lagenidium giganteum TaxID=4803 RepID=A0AAV2YV42_9STRA|nr:TPA: hypothetical protein N0F65_001261 [Lagenidium giganteum]
MAFAIARRLQKMANTTSSIQTRLLVLLLLAVALPSARGVVPTGRMAFHVNGKATQFEDMLCSPSYAAGWGVPLPEVQNSRWKHIWFLPADNAEGCTPYTLPSWPHASDLTKTLVVVDRGNCTFVAKAHVAQAAGAKGVLVRNTKKAVYDAIQRDLNITTQAENASSADAATAVPKPPFDYDCANGEAFVSTLATPEWATDDAGCARSKQCESQTCVLTGHVDAARGGHQVCCMWDTHVLMGGNRTEAADVKIPVVFATVAEGQQLARMVRTYPDLLIRTFERRAPLIDVASLLLWAIGVITAVGAAYYSALPERQQMLDRLDPERQAKHPDDSAHAQPPAREEDMFELDAKHAVGFIVCAGCFLTLLFFIKPGRIVPVLFCVSAVATMTQLIWAPLLDAWVPAIASRLLPLPAMCAGNGPDSHSMPMSEVLGMVISTILAVVWYVYRRTCWPLQDLFGITLCFVFLRTVQLPNLKVATILLSLAFVYDVFFVFISPAIFGSSVMEDVATGGPAAYTRSDYPGIDYCERYPTYPPCVDPEPMPMLLVLPRVFDWTGGQGMLGLGDIIIPGMVLSFALRFDYSPKSLGENYFRSMCIGYAVGLGMANVAVTFMQMGQPALMYLVPTCLGSLLVLAWRNGDFKAMWLGIAFEGSSKKYEDEATTDRGASGHSSSNSNGSPAVNDGHDNAPLLGQP